MGITMAKGPRIIAIVNQKGGVGKTTTTINLASALTLQGKKVLILDMDPQGNAATGLGIPRASREVTIYDVLVDGASIADATLETTVPGLKLVPSHIDLASAELEIGDRAGRTTILRDAIKGDHNNYDYILMYDPRNRLSAQVAADVRKHLGRAVFKTIIPRNVRIAEAPSFGKPVIMYDPNCAGSKAYKALATEMLSRHTRSRLT